MTKLLAALVLCLISFAHAQFYIGVPSSNIVASGGVVPMGGLAIGTYNVYGDFGVRATAQTAFTTADGLLAEGVLDGTYSYGNGVKFYTGAGLGYSSFASSGVGLGGFVGVDFDAASVISIFFEIRPTYYIRGAGAVQVRSGLNFHIGGPTPPPVRTAETGSPWLEPYAEAP